MIVQRFTVLVKRGCMKQVVEMVKAERATYDSPDRFRFYTSSFGPGDLFVQDLEFETLEEQEKHWTEWFARPTTPEFMKKWDEVVVRHVSNDIWNLVE